MEVCVSLIINAFKLYFSSCFTEVFLNCQVNRKIPFFLPSLEVEVRHERREDVLSLFICRGPGKKRSAVVPL